MLRNLAVAEQLELVSSARHHRRMLLANAPVLIASILVDVVIMATLIGVVLNWLF